MFDGNLGGFTADSPASVAKLVAEAMHDGMWELDLTNRVFHYSRNFTPIFDETGLRDHVGLPLEEWKQSTPMIGKTSFPNGTSCLSRSTRTVFNTVLSM